MFTLMRFTEWDNPKTGNLEWLIRKEGCMPGVGGTHVMYVLHHADQPEIYAGLPVDPRISPLVEAWKGAGKYAGLALIGITAAASLVHHFLFGANRVSEEDEENADRLVEENRER